MAQPGNYVFYDFETTGVSTWFDQPTQFAAVLTDGNFKEMERVNIKIALAPHSVPAPMALHVTGLSIGELADNPERVSLFKFSRQLARLIREWGPAIWTGFNSISFDEEFIRQLFYQNLQPDVYATQLNGNTRFDLQTAIWAMHAKNPGFIKLRDNDKGKKSFRLEHLADDNGFQSDNFHDALADVYATIHLAKLVADADPDLWKSMVENSSKDAVKAKLESFSPLIWYRRAWGKPPGATNAVFCGYSRENRSAACMLDLDVVENVDEMIHKMDSATLLGMMKSRERKDMFLKTAVNKAPGIMINPKPKKKHAEIGRKIDDNPQFRDAISEAFTQFAKFSPRGEQELEQMIYDGFVSDSDRSKLETFHRKGTKWEDRRDIVESLDDKRLRGLGNRLLAIYAPHVLDGEGRDEYDEFARRRWFSEDDSARWNTAAKARAQEETLRDKGAGDEFIKEVLGFLDRRGSQVRDSVTESA